MKKILLTAVAVVGLGFASQAQETRFGIKAGADFASMKVKTEFMGETFESTASETGFFVGGFAELGISDKFAVQPELLYVGIKDFNMISLPVLAKFEIMEGLHLMAGPDFNYLLDAEEDEFKINIGGGAEYDINENFDVSARYSAGMGDVSISGVFLGVGYAF